MGEWVSRGRYLIANRNDPIALARSPVADSRYVTLYAGRKYGGQVVATGKALRDIVYDCLAQIANDLSGTEPLATVFRLTSEGRTQRQIAKAIGITPEWMSRRYQKLVVSLFVEALAQRLRVADKARINQAA